MDERFYFLWLAGIYGINAEEKKLMIDEFSDPMNIYEADKSALCRLLSEEKADIIMADKSKDKAYRLQEKLFEKGIGYICYGTPEYPADLADIYDPPTVLYYIGNLKLLYEEIKLGVVGSRTPTPYGIEAANYFAAGVAETGITIVSGMAAGIDSCAHRGALAVGGKTVAVLGSGIDVPYPKNNYRLYDEICSKGLVISENPPGTEPLPFLFPLRNRIISGISKGILVVEAKKISGSLITADCAIEQNREVFAVPGKVGDALSEGTNNLIKECAHMVTEPDDITDILCRGIIGMEEGYVQQNIFDYNGEGRISEQRIRLRESKKKIKKKPVLTDDEKRIYNILSMDPKYIDEIVAESRLSPTRVLTVLFSLESRKLVRQHIKGYYIKSLRP